ncbi:MAG TPA: ribosome silencing factor [Candidatus Limnocylindria bacterium]|nr:ribosome silencing factor [Candidatus Limnocylindria bacterium]
MRCWRTSHAAPCGARSTARSTTPCAAITERAPARHGPRPLTARSRAPARGGGARLLRAAADAAVAKKAHDPVALDLRELEGVSDYFLIVSGASEVQVKAIAEAVDERLRGLGHKPWHVEGLEGRRWVLMDYVELVVHVFHERTRDYYLLERLWGDARRVDLGLESAD